MKKLNLRVLSTLGSTVGGANTKVVTGHGTYCQQVGHNWVITVAINQNMTEQDMLLVDGYIDHECGHVRFTDWDVVKASYAAGSTVKHLTNILEDIRIEALIGLRYKGAAINLNRMVQKLCEGGDMWSMPSQGMGLTSLVSCFYLYGGRYHLLKQLAMKERSELAFSLLQGRVSPELHAKFVEGFVRLSKISSSQGALVLALDIVDWLNEAKEEEQQQKEQQQQQQQQQQQSDSEESEDEGDGADGDADGDAEGDDAEGETDGDAEGDDAEGDTDGDAQGDADSKSDGDAQGDADGESDDDAQGDADGESNGDAQGDAQGEADGDASGDTDSLNGTGNGPSEGDTPDRNWFDDCGDEIMPEDICSGVAKRMNARFEETYEPGTLDPFVDSMVLTRYMTPNKCQYEINQRAVQSAQTSLKKWCASFTTSKTTARTSGSKLNGRRLAGIPAGNLRVFEHSTRAKTPSAAVQIMLDTSGSMWPVTHQPAGVACASLVKALQGLKDFAVSVIQFNDDANLVHDWETRGQLSQLSWPNGCTETAQATFAAMGNLAHRKEDTKIVFILTDGYGDLRDVVPAAQEHGCVICAIRFGDGNEMLHGLAPELQPFCADLEHLPEMFAEVLQMVMGRK